MCGLLLLALPRGEKRAVFGYSPPYEIEFQEFQANACLLLESH